MRLISKYYLRKFRRKLKEQEIYPIQDSRPDDVFVVGYPRSGHTWVQSILADLCFGINPSLAPATLIRAVVPDIHAYRYYKRFDKRAYFKSHRLPLPEYRNVIYLIRDGRDVLVSYYHFRKKTGLYTGAPDRNFLDTQREMRWKDHVEAWLENPYQANILFVRYSDLISDTVKEIGRIAAFLGLDAGTETMERVARNASFDNMLAKKDHSLHLRSGRTRQYLQELPPDELRQFEDEAGDLLKKLGYKLERDRIP